MTTSSVFCILWSRSVRTTFQTLLTDPPIPKKRLLWRYLLFQAPWWWLCRRHPCRTRRMPLWTQRSALQSVGQPEKNSRLVSLNKEPTNLWNKPNKTVITLMRMWLNSVLFLHNVWSLWTKFWNREQNQVASLAVTLWEVLSTHYVSSELIQGNLGCIKYANQGYHTNIKIQQNT